MSAVEISPEAVAELAGRSLVLRSSPRNGCCGGSAEVPVVEVGPPDDVGAYERVVMADVEVFVERSIDPGLTWVVDVDRLWRWSRLRVEPAGHRGNGAGGPRHG